MGSLNDYGGGRWRASERGQRQRAAFPRRLLRQSALALALFLLVAASVTADNFWGAGARYVAGEGLSPVNSWIDFGGSAKAQAEAVPTEPAPEEKEGAGLAESSAAPRFTAPASGVVVTELAVPASGFATEQGILIQGASGQTVKAAADAEVRYLGENEEGYIVELLHSGGFSSIYQGLSTVEISAGQSLKIGEALGVTDSGELTFSLLKDDQEVSPLEYLFQ